MDKVSRSLKLRIANEVYSVNVEEMSSCELEDYPVSEWATGCVDAIGPILVDVEEKEVSMPPVVVSCVQAPIVKMHTVVVDAQESDACSEDEIFSSSPSTAISEGQLRESGNDVAEFESLAVKVQSLDIVGADLPLVVEQSAAGLQPSDRATSATFGKTDHEDEFDSQFIAALDLEIAQLCMDTAYQTARMLADVPNAKHDKGKAVLQTLPRSSSRPRKLTSKAIALNLVPKRKVKIKTPAKLTVNSNNLSSGANHEVHNETRDEEYALKIKTMALLLGCTWKEDTSDLQHSKDSWSESLRKHHDPP